MSGPSWAKNSIHVFHVTGRVPRLGPSSTTFPDTLSGSWVDGTQTGTLKQDGSVARRSLNNCTTTPARTPGWFLQIITCECGQYHIAWRIGQKQQGEAGTSSKILVNLKFKIFVSSIYFKSNKLLVGILTWCLFISSKESKKTKGCKVHYSSWKKCICFTTSC